VSAGWPIGVAWALRSGPVIAALAALAVSPGAHFLVAIALERRRVRPSREFIALIIGDPLLAIATGVGVALSPDGVNAGVRPIVSDAGTVVVACSWLLFGLWQWRSELHNGQYSRAQAFAPTKIWHQLAVYPLLGSLVFCSVLSGLAAPLGSSPITHAAGKAAIVILVSAWVLANYYDRRHPKLGHPPYSWRRLRALPEPWPEDSQTLRSYRLISTQSPSAT
jgi:hypothetical protein